MRSRGKAGLLELLLWDIILVVLVAALAFFNGRLQASAPAVTPGSSGPSVGEGAQPNPAVTGNTKQPDAPIDTTPDEEARAKAELAVMAKRAEEKVRAGELTQALAIYEKAPPWVKTSRAWADAGPKAQARILGLQSEGDLLTCLRPEVQLAADEGNAKRVQTLLALVPTAQRKALESEASWARTHEPKNDSMQIRGFSPDRVELKGRRCSLDCELKRESASQILAEIDTLLGRGARVLGKQPGHLQIQVLGAAEGALKGGANQVFLYQRDGESATQIAPRIRLAAARWLVRRTIKRRTSLHDAFERALCGAAGGVLNAEGAARRRLFLAQRPDGSGSTLVAALALPGGGPAVDPTGMGLWGASQSSAPKDTAGVRLWALVHYAITGSDPAVVDLKARLKKALHQDERALESWLTPIKAAGIEPGLLAFMERG